MTRPTTAQTIAFLLIEGFSLMSYAAALEPLRAANLLSGRELYRWRHVSPDGAPVVASSGLRVVADDAVGGQGAFGAVMVVAGGNPALFDDPAVSGWLRGLARDGVKLGGISGGPWILARAGVLSGHRATIHWEHLPAMAEAFPHLELKRTLYEVDRDRMTCAGGVAAMDMMVELIERDHGRALAGAVADWYLRSEIRAGGTAQRMKPRERFGVANEKVLRALAYMEAHLEEPAGKAQVAAVAGVSVRQLERLFIQHLGATPADRYIQIRLDRARALLRQTGLSVTEAAMACGFVSPSHFARTYRARFGVAPRTEQGPVRR